MLRLDDDPDVLGAGDLLQRVGDLERQLLLNLQAAREHVDDARHLGEPQHLAVRNVPHVGLTDERQHVVLAHGVQLDVLHHDHLPVLGREQGIVHHLLQRLLVATGEKGHGLGGARGGVLDAGPIDVVQLCDDRGVRAHQLGKVDHFESLPENDP